MSIEGTSVASRICSSKPGEGIQLLEMNTPIDNVITLTGSLLGGQAFNTSGNQATAQIMAAMLDQGTKSQNKFVISEKLEEMGALLTFAATQYHIRFSARCLKNDVSQVIELLADQLRNPVFPEEDLEIMKTNEIGDLLRSKDETDFMVNNRYLRETFPKTHPNHVLAVEDQVELVRKLTRSDLKKYHSASLGCGSLTVVAVGDTDFDLLEEALREGFGSWQKSNLSFEDIEQTAAPKMPKAKQIVESMQEKTSVDIMLGQPIGIDRDHKDYLPLMLGHFVLGGNFSARLMSTVRDQAGLTYGIRSAVSGVDRTDGFWYVWGTFAPQLVNEGRSASIEQIERWIDGGISNEELKAKKDTILGTYKVSFGTTSGIATQILINKERGREKKYLDQYPKDIMAVSRGNVNSSIQRYCNTGKMLSVAAGSVNDKWEPLG